MCSCCADGVTQRQIPSYIGITPSPKGQAHDVYDYSIWRLKLGMNIVNVRQGWSTRLDYSISSIGAISRLCRDMWRDIKSPDLRRGEAGRFSLKRNQPTGLAAMIRLPSITRYCSKNTITAKPHPCLVLRLVDTFNVQA